ncbi:RNA polymerase sigma factor SigX [Halobacillus sp. ACCC02827]|uniref:RNA polymerase sigma factor SigX n=1 Tax=Bacillaceae TaxID=186817 RepID=UPI0004120755|nr:MULTISPECIES: RNA polymerase sigma factor SigX [Bacillaceae]QHT46908.1 RNA polymerase sigma factor SigX [Bacillus sp. SB49]WJE14130.1 RNA polymerase sigma factor SigX [Halobacillus sp. ACCC02827]
MKSFFDELYKQHHRDLFQFLIYMVKDRAVAEDLVQEVYIRVIKSYHSFRKQSSEKTWLLSIARHVAIDYFRKQKRKRDRIIETFDWTKNKESLRDGLPLPEEVAVMNEEVKEMYRALDKCSFNQRSVLILRYMQGMSIQETAEALSFSESKVKTTQHRGMKALRTHIEKAREGGGDIE